MSVCIRSLFKQSSQLFNVPLCPQKNQLFNDFQHPIHLPQISTVSNVIANLYRIFKRLSCSFFFKSVCGYAHMSTEACRGIKAPDSYRWL